MNDNEFKKNCKRTFASDHDKIRSRVTLNFKLDALHCAIGISTEAGELLDAFKKYIFYGKDLDFVNVKEELGDLLYYIYILCDSLDISLDDCKIAVVEKLKKRYPEGFTESDAIDRNLEAEREILEKKNYKEIDCTKCIHYKKIEDIKYKMLCLLDGNKYDYKGYGCVLFEVKE